MMDDLKRHLAVQQAYRLHESGASTAARHEAEKLLAERKNDLRLLHLLAMIAFAQNEFDRAASFIKQCLVQRPKDAMLHYELARILSSQGRYRDALARFDKAIALQPGYIQAIAGKADVLEREGDREAARAALAPLLEANVADDGVDLIHIRLLQAEGRANEAVECARAALSRSVSDPQSRRQLWLAVGRLHDKLGNYEEAFNAFAEAKAGQSALFRAEEYIERFDTLIATFSAENLRRIPRAANRSQTPIFIACMPRSGSTLVEQIIHAHPKAFGAGEINHITELAMNFSERIGSFQMYPASLADRTAAKAEQLSTSYLAALKKLAPSALRVTNKDIQLYQHLGLIAILFPGARIIHIRRERLDNAFACYMAGLAANAFPWVTDLKNIGIAWRQYERLMEHWRAVLDLPMLEVSYEDLVDQTEAQIRRIIDFCGLEWDDRCLRYWEADRTVMTLSYDQVRQPIFKSAVKRYERYEKFLGPLKEALAEA